MKRIIESLFQRFGFLVVFKKLFNWVGPVRRATLCQGEHLLKITHSFWARAAVFQDLLEKGKIVIWCGELWAMYVEDRRPHWGGLHYQDHIRLSQVGGDEARAGGRIKKTGPLAPLMRLSLAELNAGRIEAWLTKEVATRPTQASFAYRLFKAFLNWCATHERYSVAVDAGGILTRRIAEAIPKKTAKADCLMKEQLPSWFSAVRQINKARITFPPY